MNPPPYIIVTGENLPSLSYRVCEAMVGLKEGRAAKGAYAPVGGPFRVDPNDAESFGRGEQKYAQAMTLVGRVALDD